MKRRPDARCEQAWPQEAAKLFIWLLCLLAGVRAFLFCAAFPFFNNADEQAHFDVVLKYSQGHLPHGMERFSGESARYFVQYGSPEFFSSPEAFPDGRFPLPAWASSAEGTSAAVSTMEQAWSDATNPESWQPPLYYIVAAFWLKLGQLCGFSDSHLLYWLRSLNVLLLRSARLAEFSGSAGVLSSTKMGSVVRSNFSGIHPTGHVLRDRER
jgi:hypothetical protein